MIWGYPYFWQHPYSFFFNMIFQVCPKFPKAFTHQIQIGQFFFDKEWFSMFLVSWYVSKGLGSKIQRTLQPGLKQSFLYGDVASPLIFATDPVFMCRRAAVFSGICSYIYIYPFRFTL